MLQPIYVAVGNAIVDATQIEIVEPGMFPKAATIRFRSGNSISAKPGDLGQVCEYLGMGWPPEPATSALAAASVESATA